MWLTCVIMTMKLYFRWQKFSLRVLYKAFIWCYSVNACLQYVQNEKCVTEQYIDYGNENIKWKCFSKIIRNLKTLLYSYIIIWNYACNYRWPPKLDDLSFKNVPVYIYTKWERSNSKF